MRQSRGWSQRDLASRAVLHESILSAIETGRLIPYPRQARRIARALGAEVTELFPPPADPVASRSVLPNKPAKTQNKAAQRPAERSQEKSPAAAGR
jgi:transcriptional regulator with XRE-family HTH domain